MTDRSAPDVSYEELIFQMPESLKIALPLARWNIERLWALDLPVESVEVSGLIWQFDLPLWQLDGRRFQLSPNEAIRDPVRFSAHIRRAMQSDLEYPIHLVEHDGRWVILDGLHRLLKSVLLGNDSLMAMRLSSEDLASISG
ncbi:MAG TPA: hypothetical protein VG298_08925 [Acidimicrobiales bacterium]|jgi:hypothetical protein|nr:hypothetical protein [Acidimicrobiales bacterium]